MKGERLAQYEVAYRLGKCRQEFLRGTTAEEWLDWMVFLELKMNEREPVHYYLAQIAQFIFSIQFMFGKKKNKTKLEDFLFSFSGADEKKKEEIKPALTEKEKNRILQRSKQFWVGGVTSILKKTKGQKRNPDDEPQKEEIRRNGRNLHTGKARRSGRD
jgi:hypothetical protein